MNYETEEARKAAEGSDDESLAASPVKLAKVDKRLKKKKDRSDEDTDFQADTEEEVSDDQGGDDPAGDAVELQADAANLGDDVGRQRSTSAADNKSLYKQHSAGASRISLKSPSKSHPKSKSKLQEHSIFPAITLSPVSSGKVMKAKTGARRMPKLKPLQDQKYGTITVIKAHTPRRSEVVDLTQDKPEPEAGAKSKQANARPTVKPFMRVQLPVRSPHEPGRFQFNPITCPACQKQHPRGSCELKVAGVEHCGLCGLAHFGVSRTCPHIRSETQVREMLRALKNSPEKKELVDLAVKYLRGVKGTLVQQKKRDKEKAMMQGANQDPSNLARPPTLMHIPPQGQYTQGTRPFAAAHQLQDGTLQQYPLPRPVPGSVGNYISSQGPQQSGSSKQPKGGDQQGRWGQGGQVNAAPIDDHHVESALRGFLGQSNQGLT